MNNSTPFRRVNLMMAAIAALAAQGMSMPSIMAQVGTYQSRGKGRGTAPTQHGHKHASKYMPHQGQRECARRVRQMARNEAKVIKWINQPDV